MTRTPTLLASVALLALLGACHRDSAPVTAAPTGPAPAAAPAMPDMPGMPGMGAAAPASAATATGTVEETMNASTYTYVRVKTPQGDIWAAAGQFKVAKGDKVVVPLNMPMSNFESRTLHRTFPMIYFASQIEVLPKGK